MKLKDFLYINEWPYKGHTCQIDTSGQPKKTLALSVLFKIRHIETGEVFPAVIAYRQSDRKYKYMVMVQRAGRPISSTLDTFEKTLVKLREIGQCHYYGSRCGSYEAKRELDKPQNSYSVAEFENQSEYNDSIMRNWGERDNSARVSNRAGWKGIVLTANIALRLNGFVVCSKRAVNRRSRESKPKRKVA